MGKRKIIHIDMDAFFAAVEQRDHPELRGKPVIVGGRPRARGAIVSTCSYEARPYGVRSGMPSMEAARLCPDAIFVRGNFAAYKEASQMIREIFHDYTDIVEPLSLDEAYLDVTKNKKDMPSATWIAQQIRERIQKNLRLTASAGVSYNKFLAKVASDFKKPDGLTVVTPQNAEQFLDALPIRKFHGVGKVTEKRMQNFGIFTGAELRKHSLETLTIHFGKIGRYYHDIVRGIDHRPVQTDRVRKSVSKETTLPYDLVDHHQMLDVLKDIAEKLTLMFSKGQASGLTLHLKVRYSDYQVVTRSFTGRRPFTETSVIYKTAASLLKKTEAGRRPVRLLGIGVSNLVEDNDSEPMLPSQLVFSFYHELEESPFYPSVAAQYQIGPYQLD